MFTLQVLDCGQTFLRPLDGAPLLIGADPTCDLRLAEAEVLPRHARIEPTAAGCRIVAMGKLLVNGRATMQTDLVLGDRIEIGRAVLMVGRNVVRQAVAEDVLAEPRVRTARSRPSSPGRSKLLPILAALGLLGGVAWFACSGDDGSAVRSELAILRRTIDDGDLERAKAQLERLRSAWAGATDDRGAALQGVADRVAGIEAREAALAKEVLASERTYAQWILELQRREAADQPEERIAAHRVRSGLAELLRKRPPRVVTGPVTGSPAASPDSPTPVPTPTPTPVAAGPGLAPAGPAPAVAPTAVDTVADALADARQLVAAGNFAQAMNSLQAAAGEAGDPAAVKALQAEILVVREGAGRAATAAVDAARALVVAGKLDEALQMLTSAQLRFPAIDECRGLTTLATEVATQRAEAERRARRPGADGAGSSPAGDSAVRAATLAALQSHLARVRVAEDGADFAAAVGLLREAATLVRERDADFALRLDQRADEAVLLAAWHGWVVARAAAGKPVAVPLRDGRTLDWTGVDGARLVGTAGGAAAHATWHEVAAEGVKNLAALAPLAGDAALGAATLLYRAGEAPAAEALLLAVHKAEPSRLEEIGRVVARGRGEPWDPRGYAVEHDSFVSARSAEQKRLSQQIASRLDGVLRNKDQAVREAFVTEVLSQGPDAIGCMVAAFRRELDLQIARLEGGQLRKQIDKLQAQRDELDRRRKHARDLIYDEVRYFYPYKPPAVSSDRYAEYSRVQAEVDRRVAALREAWRDDKLRVRIPASLRVDLDRLDFVAKVLGELGEIDVTSLQRIEWARALPAGDAVGVAEFCRTTAEREELEAWRAIEAWNAHAVKKVPTAVREQLQITNEYRAMFRHRPLALAVQLDAAAQGHADEMNKLGYFAHNSPTPGRRTPYDRMRLAGYLLGSSENIALNDGAAAAHDAWCHSSGHHRNLLNPNHREMGIGAAGRYWVQNFGAGTTYTTDPAWKPRVAGH